MENEVVYTENERSKCKNICIHFLNWMSEVPMEALMELSKEELFDKFYNDHYI